jgi:hypothetical protein
VTLGCLVAAAAVVVGLLVSLTGHTPAKTSGPRAQDVPVQAPSSAIARHPVARTSARPARSSAIRPASAVAGDTGRVLEAVNAFRSRHGVRPVPGAVTSAAIGCAASQGDPSACPSSYFWEPVVGADGNQVVQKITGHPDGTSFLLDPRIKRLQIGWKSEGSGTWECALVATY